MCLKCKAAAELPVIELATNIAHGLMQAGREDLANQVLDKYIPVFTAPERAKTAEEVGIDLHERLSAEMAQAGEARSSSDLPEEVRELLDALGIPKSGVVVIRA